MDSLPGVIRDTLRHELSSLPLPLPIDAAEKISGSIHAGIEEIIRLRAEAALYDFLDSVPPFTTEQIARITRALRGGGL